MQPQDSQRMVFRKILVLGASGYVGSRLIPLLLQKGYYIKAASREPEKLANRLWANHPRVSLIRTDVLDKETLNVACLGCETIFYLVHSMHSDFEDYPKLERMAAYNLADCAEGLLVKRIIYLGGLGEESENLSRHLHSRLEVGKILRKGSVPVTILRAAMILGAGSLSFEIMRRLIERSPIMVTSHNLSTRSQPIAIRNVLQYAIGCLENPQTAGKTYDIGGPDVLSYRDVINIFMKEARLWPRLILPLSSVDAHASARWIEWVTKIPAKMAEPLAEGLGNEVVCQENRIRDVLPQHLLNCGEAIRLAIDPQQFNQRSVEGMDLNRPSEWKHPGDPPWVGGKRYSSRRLRSLTDNAYAISV